MPNRNAAAMLATSPLNPANFTSLGTSPFSTAGTYTIDASKDNAALPLSGPGIVTPTMAGSYTFTIKAKKNNSTCEGARTYTMVVP